MAEGQKQDLTGAEIAEGLERAKHQNTADSKPMSLEDLHYELKESERRFPSFADSNLVDGDINTTELTASGLSLDSAVEPRKILDYSMVRAENIGEFHDFVHAHLADGWQPYGNPFPVNNFHKSGELVLSEFAFAQAMVKYSDG